MSDFTGLVAQAQRVREHIIRMATDGGCFIGASLSCADLMVYLYDARAARDAPTTLADPERDYLLLSKGHDVPALYGTLAERGYFPLERLAQPPVDRRPHLLAPEPRHPGRRVPLGLARPPALGGDGDRDRHQAARRAEPRVRRRSATASWTKARSGRRPGRRAPSSSTTWSRSSTATASRPTSRPSR